MNSILHHHGRAASSSSAAAVVALLPLALLFFAVITITVPSDSSSGFVVSAFRLPTSSSSFSVKPRNHRAAATAKISRVLESSSSTTTAHIEESTEEKTTTTHRAKAAAVAAETEREGGSSTATTSASSSSAAAAASEYDPSKELVRLLEEFDPVVSEDGKEEEDEKRFGLSSSFLEETPSLSSKKLEEPESSTSTLDDDDGDDAICLDLDGRPLSKEYFARTMGVAGAVESYDCPEEDAFRGYMSNACRVHLRPGNQKAFYKRIVFDNLDHAKEKLKTSPFKLTRDAQSYDVVASFLKSTACRLLTEQTGVRIPRCYDAVSQPDYENPIKSKFSFLFEDLSPSDGWYQEWLLCDERTCETALTTFAKIHAYFWTGSDFWTKTTNDNDHPVAADAAAKELEDAIWKSGSYVQPKAQGENQWKEVANEWSKKKWKFQTQLSDAEYWDDLGERLESVADRCGRLAHPFAEDDDGVMSERYKQYRTFTHGDPKQANLLFREPKPPTATATTTTTAAAREEKELLEIGLIDFQWSGFGLAATDIAHFVTSAVHAGMLVDGGEEKLMKYYYRELLIHLVEFGAYPTEEIAAQNYDYRKDFVEQYEIAVLDICRLAIAYTFDRFTEAATPPPPAKDEYNDEDNNKEEEEERRQRRARTMNKTSYQKSIPNAVWLTNRCDEILRSRGI